MQVQVQDAFRVDSKSKKVIMCRSGYQKYSREDILRYGLNPKEVKDYYTEYRPAGVVMDAIDKFKFIPITKEHPSTWVTEANEAELAKGFVGDSINVVSLDNEIGLQANLIFKSNDIKDYYKQGSREVSVGYTATKELVEDSSLPYDIILKSIDTVNHLAVTARGRGGSKVAILDSLVNGGERMGILEKLGIVKKKDESTSFGEKVYDALVSTRGMVNDSDVKKALAPFAEMIQALPESDKRDGFLSMVSDSFEEEISLEALESKKQEVVDAFDAAYAEVADAEDDNDQDPGEDPKPVNDSAIAEKVEELTKTVNTMAETMKTIQDSVSDGVVKKAVQEVLNKPLGSKGGSVVDSTSTPKADSSSLAVAKNFL